MVSPELPYRKVHWWLLFTCSVVSNSLQPHELQHARLPCHSLSPRVCSNSTSRWCHPTILSSVFPFSSRLQSFLASGSFLMSQFFTSGGQSTGVSAWASVLPMNIQDWLPLGWTGWISLQSKGLSRVFSSTNRSYQLTFYCVTLQMNWTIQNDRRVSSSFNMMNKPRQTKRR